MRSGFRFWALTTTALLLIVAGAVPAAAGGRPLSTGLAGAAEVPGPGDSDGAGQADLRLNQGQRTVCFDISVTNVAAITAAHIHRGGGTVAGPIVVDFQVATNGLEGCVSATKDLIKEIRQHPDRFYVNVHNPGFPAGALRGQLSK